MTVVRTNSAEFAMPGAVNSIPQRALGIGLLFGVASLIFALVPATREQFFHSYLIGFMLWLGVSLGSMAILILQHLTGGKWAMVIRRQLEAAMNTLPLMAALFVPIAAAGIPYLYNGNHEPVGGWPGWLHYEGADAHLKAMSQSYLTVAGYRGRAVIYFAIWLGLAFILSRWSAEQDHPPLRNLSPRFRLIAAP